MSIGRPLTGMIFKSPDDNSFFKPRRGMMDYPKAAITACLTASFGVSSSFFVSFNPIFNCQVTFFRPWRSTLFGSLQPKCSLRQNRFLH